MPVPFSFGAATTAIPLSQLDSNFNTPITLGNTAIQLGNTVTTLNNMTLANVTISSGNVTITNVTVTTANATTVNTTTLIATTANVTTGNVTNLISGNVTLTGGSITGTPISGSTGSFTTLTTSSTVTLNGGTANGVAYLDGSKVLTTGSALVFNGTQLGINGSPSQALDVTADATAIAAFRSIGSSGNDKRLLITSGGDNIRLDSANQSGGAASMAFSIGSSEQMRLTSTGLGIGTSSPTGKLQIKGTVNFEATNSTNVWNLYTFTDNTLRWNYNGAGADELTLDSSGNLGLGVTPSAWNSIYKAMQFGPTGAIYSSSSNDSFFSNNTFWNASNSPRYIVTAAATYYYQNAGAHTWATAPSGTAGNAITFTQAMTLTAGGSLLIGTTTDPGDNLYTPGSIRAATVKVDGGAYITGPGSDVLAMYAGSNERARITSGGDFVVTRATGGDTTVGSTLYADGTITAARSSSSNGDLNLYVYSTGAAAARFYVGMGGTVYATSTTITAISDQRLKENIQDIDVGLDAIMALKPRKFDWKAGKGKDKKGDRGWIAQEFEQVFPDMIDTWADPAPEGEEPYKAVNADLIPILVKAIQELKAEFDAYKATHP